MCWSSRKRAAELEARTTNEAVLGGEYSLHNLASSSGRLIIQTNRTSVDSGGVLEGPLWTSAHAIAARSQQLAGTEHEQVTDIVAVWGRASHLNEGRMRCKNCE